LRYPERFVTLPSDIPLGVPAPGDVLSEKYRIEQVIGMGGMGVVLAARHITLGQRLAVKVLRPELARHPEASERFLREARACTNLRSEHVARVLDVGTLANGAPYMVMEFLDGRDLHELGRSGAPLPIAESVAYMLQAAEALAEAHGMGIVHRDLKPANLFLTTSADGSPLVKVLDFGISKATTPGERGITSTDAVLGSPGYMAPEQIRSAKSVDQRADIWGLGVSLYELLTGAPPFDGASVAAVSVQIVMETPKLAHELRPDVPEALSQVVARCLEKDPAKRYANMAELAEAILPFAPAGSEEAVERVRRILRGSVVYGATLALSDPALARTVAAGTGGAWGRTAAARTGRRTLTLGVTGALVAAALLGGVYALGRNAAKPEAAKEKPTLSGAPPGTPEPVIAPHVAPIEPARPSESPGSAASEDSHGAHRTVKAPSTSARGACAKGQALSSGHCCPTGLVWQKGGCDRPLAVTLP
jgi:tRNA A-37 threonylcarbamoyl transferase component Bud32